MREAAYHHIQRKIAQRELRAGAPVSDVAIAKELGISRTPAREAIHRLVSEGLLESAGRGVVVVTLDRADIRDLYEMREALEVRAARTVAEQKTKSGELRDFEKIADVMKTLVKDLESSRMQALSAHQMARFEAADLAFHTYLMRLSGNRRSMKTVSGIRLLIRIFAARRDGHSLPVLKQICRDHLDVVAAIRTGDADAATETLTRHISESRRSRLEEFDRREHEAALPQNIDAFLAEIESELA